MHTPAKALEAMAAPAPLTMGQVALLDLYKCPLLDLNYDDVNATAFALNVNLLKSIRSKV